MFIRYFWCISKNWLHFVMKSWLHPKRCDPPLCYVITIHDMNYHVCPSLKRACFIPQWQLCIPIGHKTRWDHYHSIIVHSWLIQWDCSIQDHHILMNSASLKTTCFKWYALEYLHPWKQHVLNDDNYVFP